MDELSRTDKKVVMADIKKQIGEKIRKTRLAKGLSQEELAFETDLHRTCIGPTLDK